MNKPDTKEKVPFGEDFWKEDGGDRWVENIDILETSISGFDEKLLERACVEEGETVLDVGCGGGLNSLEIAGRVGPDGRVTGMDISARILEVARDRAKSFSNLDFMEADAATADLGKGTFNLIFSRFGVMFFSDPVMGFKNLNQALKQSGRLVFLCWRTIDENPWMNEPAQAVFEVIPPQGPPPDPDAPGPFAFGIRDRIEVILGKSGFNTVDIEAIDSDMKLGGLQETVDYFTRMGPAAVLMEGADEALKQSAKNALRRVLENYQSDDGIVMQGAAWIVTAR